MPTAAEYARYRARGLCGTCNALATPGRATCERCRRVSRERAKAHQQMLIDSGLCRQCGKAEAAPGRTRCEPCRSALLRHKAESDARKPPGSCQKCRQPATHGILCAKHREKAREAERRRRAR